VVLFKVILILCLNSERWSCWTWLGSIS